MKFGILSDAHGNAYGLKACLKYLLEKQVDEILFLGDVVGYMPDVSDVIVQLQKYNVRCLLGNHDAMLVGAAPLDERRDRIYQIRVVAERMTELEINFISKLKPWYEAEVDGKRLLFVHGSPRNPLSEYVYPHAPIEWFDRYDYDAFFLGHTHRPFVRYTQSGKLIVNVGSCGLPRDQGNLCSLAVYDSHRHVCDIYRVKFEAQKLVERYTCMIHESVKECLQREDKTAFGTIINERTT